MQRPGYIALTRRAMRLAGYFSILLFALMTMPEAATGNFWGTKLTQILSSIDISWLLTVFAFYFLIDLLVLASGRRFEFWIHSVSYLSSLALTQGDENRLELLVSQNKSATKRALSFVGLAFATIGISLISAYLERWLF